LLNFPPLIEVLRTSARAGSLPKKDCSVEHGKVELVITNFYTNKNPIKTQALHRKRHFFLSRQKAYISLYKFFKKS